MKIRIKGQASFAQGVVIQVEDDDGQDILHEQVTYVLRGRRERQDERTQWGAL